MDKLKPCIFLLLVVSSAPSYAYIGPGMAGGAIAAIIGVVVSVFLLLFGILYYPIKRSLRNRRSKRKDYNENEDSTKDLEPD